MAVPDHQTLVLPVWHLCTGGRQSVAECFEDLKAKFAIREDDAAELLPSGRMTRLCSRAHWARTYLGKAGLLTSPKRGYHEIADAGRALLAIGPDRIDNNMLEGFPAFAEWKSQPAQDAAATDPASSSELGADQTPEDAMQFASRIINDALREELISALMQVSPVRFERLILDLLSAMNFGRGDLENSRMTPGSGDGGIDGIINEDALGLDAVYIQAKRYAPDNKVGRPDIQRFVGSLTGESATKGVFVTTSSFSKAAHDYIDRVQQRIVLIDGDKLAQLMIAHEVGVRIRSTYFIKSLDEVFFRYLTTKPP